MDPLVSIVMPAHNSAQFIGRSINSVIAQTYRNWELIVVDDGSRDETSNIVSLYVKNDSRISLLKGVGRGGAARARNLAIEMATGRFIAFLDSDDIWLPEKLEIQISAMLESGAPLSFTAYKKIDGSDIVGPHTFSVPNSINYHQLLKTNVIGCLTAIYDCSQLDKCYMPDIEKRQDLALWLHILKKIGHEDYALWLKILKNTKGETRLKNKMPAIGINQVLAHYRVHNNTLSSNKFKAALYQWFVYRKVEKLGLLRSMYYFTHYSILGLSKFLKK